MSTETVPKGYKRTEVGVIPEEWELQHIGALGSGAIPAIKAGPFGSALTKDQYVSSGYKVYGQEQVIRGDYLYGEYFVDGKKYRTLESCSVRPGDILLSLVGTVGKLLEIPEDAPQGVINPRLLRFSLDRKKMAPRYFRYLFESSIVQSRLESQAQGGTMGVLNAGVFRSFLIALPKVAEQEAIAAALSDADALIEALESLLDKKRQIKKGAMQELLTGKRRLPGFEIIPGFKATETGRIPRDWDVKSISNVASIKTGPFGTILKASEYAEFDGVPLISVGEVRNGFLQISDHTPKISVSVTRRLPQYILRAGDIVFGRKGAVDRSAVVKNNEDGWFLGSDGIAIRPMVNISTAYLGYRFQSTQAKSWLLQNAIGTTMPSLNQSILGNLSIPVPASLPEQSAIAAVLSDMDSELEALEAKLDKARQIKQGMMQQLLTGKVRLV